jgi:hypothetical protein
MSHKHVDAAVVLRVLSTISPNLNIVERKRIRKLHRGAAELPERRGGCFSKTTSAGDHKWRWRNALSPDRARTDRSRTDWLVLPKSRDFWSANYCQKFEIER